MKFSERLHGIPTVNPDVNRGKFVGYACADNSSSHSAGPQNRRVRHCVESTSKQAGCLAGRRRGTEGLWQWGCRPLAGEGIQLIPAARREESTSEMVEADKGAGGNGTARTVQLAATTRRRRADDAATAQKASRAPGNPPTLASRTENGGPEKERIPFCRAGGDGKRR